MLQLKLIHIIGSDARAVTVSAAVIGAEMINAAI